MKRHTNLFAHHHDHRSVREQFETDYSEDHPYLMGLDIVGVIAVAFLLRHLWWPDIVAGLTVYFCFGTGVRYFVEQSARNYFLHSLDWEEAAYQRRRLEDGE